MTKRISIKTAILLSFIILIIVLQLALSSSSSFQHYYLYSIFPPLQIARNYILNFVNMSVGDIFYLILIFSLLFILGRFLFFAFTYKRNKKRFIKTLFYLLLLPLLLYFSFLILWGGNYYRKAVHDNWPLQTQKWDKEDLLKWNLYLVEKLNELYAQQKNTPQLTFNNINELSNQLYQKQFPDISLASLKVKKSSLGRFLNYMGVHGYYNPFSGEAQINHHLPLYMHPFVMAHEMAHQAGVAKEDDANLIAYIICIKSEDLHFKYSGYFNLYLYASSNLKQKDPELFEETREKLSPNVIKDIKDLRKIYKRYRGIIKDYSNYLYDEYLIWQGQEMGLDTYNEVVQQAYYWEYIQHQNIQPSL